MKKIFPVLLLLTAAQLAKAQNVGIGTASPNASAQLDITSTTKGLLIPRMTSSQRTEIASPVAGLMVYETTTGSFWFYNGSLWNQIGTGGVSPWTVSGNNIYNSNTGNVGIGTGASPSEKLSVKGNLFVTYTNANDLVNGGNRAVLNLHASGSGIGVVNFLEPDTTVGASVLYSTSLNQLYLRNGTNTNQIVLRNDGDVGIGTSSPTQRLDVSGNIRSRDTITADNDIVAGVDIRAGADITAGGMIEATGTVRGSALNSTGVLTVSGNSLFGGTAVVNGELSTNTGLTVNDAAGTLQFKTGGVDKGFVQLSGDNLRIGVNTGNLDGKFVVRTAGADQFFIDNAGYVGIGLGANFALARVHVAGGADASLTTNGYMMFGYPNGTNLTIDNNEIMVRGPNETAGNMVLQNDGGTVRIGNVAVPAGYKFAVNGKMICEELRVKLAASWPDYVFNDDYKLLPLSALKKFIAENSHLPNIPKASVAEKEGIEVGDMQKRLLEKVEELTLYILQLEERLNKLELQK